MQEKLTVGVRRLAGDWRGPAAERVVLDYEGRFLRRKRLVAVSGRPVMVHLSETVSLDDGDALEAVDGTLVAVEAAAEAVLKITGHLPRLAWHIGNRHTPCQISADHLMIRDDHVLAGMLQQLGATVTPMVAPFTPDRGAYGLGRTHGHSHASGHEHDHSQSLSSKSLEDHASSR